MARDRAIRRAGELLQQVQPGKNRFDSRGAAADTPINRRDAAEQAGMSVRQQITALRVANVPAADFERAVERDKPATVTALAAMGTKPAPRPITTRASRCRISPAPHRSPPPWHL